MSIIVLVTGGFDPLHSGHIHYLQAARDLGDRLIVGINSDDWLVRKKGKAFLPARERRVIMENLRMVDEVIEFVDLDNTAIQAILDVKQQYPHDVLVFANGGDRTEKNIPEMCVPGVVFEFGVGGDDKKNSSSWILNNWQAA